MCKQEGWITIIVFIVFLSFSLLGITIFRSWSFAADIVALKVQQEKKFRKVDGLLNFAVNKIIKDFNNVIMSEKKESSIPSFFLEKGEKAFIVTEKITDNVVHIVVVFSQDSKKVMGIGCHLDRINEKMFCVKNWGFE
ncbi:MAG: hypothetical protein UR26_C0005G0051 [candidate division TM6 bacterium GW2011_GWF2_32_72]|nr:MAG: hypothetical protein UR26_C0005G0051 [candidate division TM6 bacterium GW2011_GWF2_32_72]